MEEPLLEKGFDGQLKSRNLLCVSEKNLIPEIQSSPPRSEQECVKIDGLREKVGNTALLSRSQTPELTADSIRVVDPSSFAALCTTSPDQPCAHTGIGRLENIR